MVRFEEITKVLNEYKRAALEEYSALEKSRHNHFKFQGYDGSSTEAVEYWLTELKNHVGGKKSDRQVQELSRQILTRSTPFLKEFYKSIKDPEEKETFLYMLLKTEASILKKDHERATSYFDIQPQQPALLEQLAQLIPMLSAAAPAVAPVVAAVERTKTKYEVFEDYLNTATINKKTQEAKNKIIQVITMLLQASDKEYLVDYNEEDYDEFMFILAYTPAYISSQRSRIFDFYEKNYRVIAHAFDDETLNTMGYKDIDFQTIKTVGEKFVAIRNFAEYCVKKKHLERNVFEEKDEDDEDRFKLTYFEDIVKEGTKRRSFNNDEIEKFFMLLVENNYYRDKIAYFYIPIISLFSGMRIEEICKLKVENIIIEDKIYCFNITPPTKTKSSIRKVPIHSILIDKFELLKYVSKRRKEGHEYLFDLKRSIIKGAVKHSHDFGKDFQLIRDSFVSEMRIKEDLITFHSFRHTFATRLASTRKNYFISELMGHAVKKENETGTYVDPTIEHLKDEIELYNYDSFKAALIRLERGFKSRVSF